MKRTEDKTQITVRFEKVGLGLLFILAAVLIILEASGVLRPLLKQAGGISLFRAALSLLLLCYAIGRLLRGKPAEIFLPLAIIFMLLEKNIAHLLGREDPNIISNGLVILAAVLLSIGISILTPKRRRRGGADAVCFSKRLGSSTYYVDSSDFVSECIENNLGSSTVHFENVEHYTGGGVLHLENNMGSITVYVPSAWNLTVEIENHLGVIRTPPASKAEGPTLTVTGENNLGSVAVELI